MEVLKLFAPYGPAWLGGVLLTLVASSTSGDNFLRSTNAKTSGRASST